MNLRRLIALPPVPVRQPLSSSALTLALQLAHAQLMGTGRRWRPRPRQGHAPSYRRARLCCPHHHSRRNHFSSVWSSPSKSTGTSTGSTPSDSGEPPKITWTLPTRPHRRPHAVSNPDPSAAGPAHGLRLRRHRSSLSLSSSPHHPNSNPAPTHIDAKVSLAGLPRRSASPGKANLGLNLTVGPATAPPSGTPQAHSGEALNPAHPQAPPFRRPKLTITGGAETDLVLHPHYRNSARFERRVFTQSNRNRSRTPQNRSIEPLPRRRSPPCQTSPELTKLIPQADCAAFSSSPTP